MLNCFCAQIDKFLVNAQCSSLARMNADTKFTISQQLLTLKLYFTSMCWDRSMETTVGARPAHISEDSPKKDELVENGAAYTGGCISSFE